MAELADFTNKMQARQRARALHRGLAAFLCGEARGSFMGDEAVRMFGAFERSTPTIENVVKTVYFEALQLKLDEALLGTAAGTAVQSAGLRNGINSLAASAAADPLSKMLEDVKTVVSAVATVANNSEIILVASPSQAVTLRGWRDRVRIPFMDRAPLPTAT